MQLITLISTLFVVSGIASAILIALDLRLRPQSMRIMNSVWILTGLWGSLLALWAYYWFGRTKSQPPHMDEMKMEMDMGMHSMKGMVMELSQEDSMSMPEMEGMEMKRSGRWQSIGLSALHCGAGCALADIVGEWFTYFVPVSIGGSLVAGSWAIDYLLALTFGIGFQYAAISQMERATSRTAIVVRAAKADILSLTAWQAGMYIWMGIAIFGFGDGTAPSRASFWFWFMMQIAMLCGLLTALPMNAWLIRKGIKQGM